ncbi:MAG TPA: NAD(P)H-dependent oxidoreductase [Dinghuibacter sp.]|jgi:nitroreductase|uniref:NAD(P)H-dependent oxidoreductase n=1 Tax=Dinghuibacter sp. TaxID=2024697 RepID=UPI002C3F40C9|nr:NAD(P)H-dependent oxidoreductase [Dinghuibacter sp.]HTJ15111.1 NAD(P)H-dependent oxidoreductase [Dinghuibacter sp.]
MSLIEALNWRYATKRMNGNKIDPAKLENILEATRLSVSAVGLQPYNIIVIESPELREKIKPIAFNQPQITEASHLLVFAAWDKITEARFDEFIQDVADQRGVTVESLNGFQNYKKNMLSRTDEENYHSAVSQTHIAFGTAVAAAALEHVDATPMGGFNHEALDELLGLKEKGLKSEILLALGHRDESQDWLVGQKKVRRPKEKLFVELA